MRSGLANRSKALWPNRSAVFRSIDKAPLQRLGIVSQGTISPAHGLLDITVSLLRDTNMGRVNARTRIGHRHQPIPVGTVQGKRSLTFESGVSTRSFWCGIERDELRPDTDPALLHELVLGPVYYRLLLSGQPLAADFAERVVDAVRR